VTATTLTRPTRGADPSNRISPTARHDVRRTLLALFASALGIVPLCELFVDRGWLIDVWASMLVVVGPAALLRLRRAPSAGQIWVGMALLVPWLTLRFVHQHAVAGIIPLHASWRDVGALMTNLHHTTSEQAAPVHSTVALRLTMCALLALVAALVDLIAVVGRRGALAGIPLLVVFTVSGAVPRQVVSWWLFAVAAAAFLLLLALDSSDDLHRWGHYVPRAGQDRRRAAGTAGAISGQRIAAVSIVLAIIAPVFMPSDSRNLLSNLFHNSSTGGSGSGFGSLGGGSIDPFVALKGQLDRKTPVKLFTVAVRSLSGDRVGSAAAIQPFYLRENVLSQFVGTGWRPGSAGGSEPLDRTGFASSPGTDYPPRTVAFRANISVAALDSNPPIFAIPTAVDGLGADVRWSTQDQLLVGARVSQGARYQLVVAQPAPSTADLRAASALDPAMARWLTLPRVASYVRSLVARIVANRTTPYDKARAISDYFADPANGFSYSLATVIGDSGDQLVDFLHNKVGYCQQYAAAMAVMLRVARVPSRVVLGYSHPVPDSTGNFTVTTDDAHAWVEAYFSGLGWIPFDPTPLSGIAGGSSNDLTWAPHSKSTTGDNSVPKAKPTIGSPTAHPSATKSANAAIGSRGAGPGELRAMLIWTGIAAVIILTALTPWAVRQKRRQRRLRAGRQGDTDALWRELSDTAVDMGYVWSAARTPRQVAAWLARPSGAAAGSLHALATAVEHARYAPDGTASDGRHLVNDLAAVRAGLNSRQALGARVRAWLWPASLGWHRPRRPARGERRH